MKTKFFSLLCFLFSYPAIIYGLELQTGLTYQSTTDKSGSITHVFKVDPTKLHLKLLKADDYQVSALTAKRYQERSQALLVINGGFFDEAFRSLGLLVKDGKILQPLRQTSWGVFLLGGVSGKTPAIISKKEWAAQKNVSMALQVGPRLVVDGKIQNFRESVPARRSALGITREGLVEIALTESFISLHDWAVILQKDCRNALNLDGGGSTQISVKTPTFSLDIEGMTSVPNAIGVF